jgi:hypothetical protein
VGLIEVAELGGERRTVERRPFLDPRERFVESIALDDPLRAQADATNGAKSSSTGKRAR